MQRAQDSVEYGLLLATVALVVLIFANAFGGAIREWFIRLAQVITSK